MPAAARPSFSPAHPSRRSAASLARRAARRERRRARRWRTAAAGLLLGALGLAGVAGLYKSLGQDPRSVQPVSANRQDFGQAAATAAGHQPGTAPAAQAVTSVRAQAPTPALLGGLRPVRTAPAGQTGTAARTDLSADLGPGKRAGPGTAAPANPACAHPPCLPYMAGAQEIDDGSGASGPGGAAPARTWAATLSSSQPMAQVADYYRQQLSQLQRPGDAPVRESQPAPGQLLLTMTLAPDRVQQSVWIGQAGPQVLIRLVRALPDGP